ncbi:MAG: bifunctional DNA primase/polymerase [Thermoflexales bacterium]|nr:bifunctional DNA primase/polymerase [Thermoflexales bacterium]
MTNKDTRPPAGQPAGATTEAQTNGYYSTPIIPQGTPASQDGLGAWALWYAQVLGWYIFPCDPGGKLPFQIGTKPDGTPRRLAWSKWATTDPAKIRKWWARNPTANIGVACGPSCLGVLDVDTKGGVDGYSSLEELKRQVEIDTATWAQTTPSGGMHFAYYANGCDVRNSTGKLGAGLDVRGAGGFAVLTPSKLEGVGAYQWVSGFGPGDIAPLPWPAALVNYKPPAEPAPALDLAPVDVAPVEPAGPALEPAPPTAGGQVGPAGPIIIPQTAGDPRAYAQAALAGELAKLRAAVEGQRNDTLNTAAFSLGQLAGAGLLDRGTVENELTAAGLAVGLGEHEVLATVKSGLDAGQADPRDLASLGDLPGAVTALGAAPAPSTGTATGATKPARFTVYWASEALVPQAPIAWVVKNLFSAGTVNLVVGTGGSLKTYTLLDCALAVALGKSFLEFETTQAPALVIDEESGKRRLDRRLAELMHGYQAGDKTPLAYVTMARFDARKAADVNALHALMVELGARFVVIDALVDVMLGGDENAVKDTQPTFANLRLLADATQAAIVVIHHTNKAGTYRGSTAMQGAVDLLLAVERERDSNKVTFTVEKARDFEPHRFAAQVVFDDGWVSVEPATAEGERPRLGKAEAYVVRYLRQKNGLQATVQEIMDKADVCSDQAARQAVYRLAGRGYTQRVDSGSRGTAATYALDDSKLTADGL